MTGFHLFPLLAWSLMPGFLGSPTLTLAGWGLSTSGGLSSPVLSVAPVQVHSPVSAAAILVACCDPNSAHFPTKSAPPGPQHHCHRAQAES